MSIVARINGRKSFAKNGRKHMSAIGRKGAEARWGKKGSKGYRSSTKKTSKQGSVGK